MISFAVAWVAVTAIKHDSDGEICGGFFFLTGILDCIMVGIIVVNVWG